MRIAIDASYTTNTSSKITLPEGKTWADVYDWYIKWDTLYINWKGSDDWEEYALNSDSSDGIDWKRPTCASIYAIDENDEIDYDAELAAT